MLQRIRQWLFVSRRWRIIGFVLAITVLMTVLYVGYRISRSRLDLRDPRNRAFLQWFSAGDQQRQSLITVVQQEPCPGAPFVLPAEGYIGLLYGDPRPPYSTSRRHQGIDIFSPGGPGETPVYAAYDGYLTREASWRSSLIIRVPDDPLQPGRQIWLYYTHMANAEGTQDTIEDAFPPGTYEVFVQRGTLLGYTGDYSGSPLRTVAVHLHFSIVLDDGTGKYRNELEFANTVDPSPYLGMRVNYACAPVVPVCTETPLCADSIGG